MEAPKPQTTPSKTPEPTPAGVPFQRAVPPPYLCFTVPRFQFLPAAEALLGLIFANLFWVGLWDLLDATVFPAEGNLQLISLIILGALGMYFTDSLYDVLPDNKDVGPFSELFGGGENAGENYGATEANGRNTPGPREPEFEDGWDLDEKDVTIQDQPFVPPRFEFWRLLERVTANVAAVFIWVGIWDSIDVNFLPVQCSYNACGRCVKYGQFPCAWYKILFTLIGLVGQYFTRGLYTDAEVTYVPRNNCCPCCGGDPTHPPTLEDGAPVPVAPKA